MFVVCRLAAYRWTVTDEDFVVDVFRLPNVVISIALYGNPEMPEACPGRCTIGQYLHLKDTCGDLVDIYLYQNYANQKDDQDTNKRYIENVGNLFGWEKFAFGVGVGGEPCAGTQTKTIPVQPVKLYSPTFFKDRTVNTFAGYVHASFVSQSKLFDQSDSADRWQRLMLSPATDLSLFFASCC